MIETTRSAKEAAAAIGCSVSQIAKCLVFRGRESGTAVLVIASGSNRVNEKAFVGRLGEEIVSADADFVRNYTGFVIGGGPPIGHLNSLRTFLDEDLFAHDLIWAAAGTPFAVFRLTPADLKNLTQGEVVTVR
jgi:prolyl-tRNA editing enzyme YbaK/EbsC (Cys-tRNA(Pro) deacylase)